MPGLKPGTVCSSRRPFPQPRDVGPMNSRPITCPVMHCNRMFDDRHLLLGHLKRFDHSPCDPAIYLHGVCNSSYVCLVCQHPFTSSGEYAAHLAAKVQLSDGHHQSLSPLAIQCFACPSCFLLYNQRDECLKHMSASNHFVRSFRLGGESGVPRPIPMPSYAKRVLVALCKDIPFEVVCTSCRCELRSHVEVSAHFRTLCRNAGPVSLSEKSVAQVASVFQLKAFCQTCRQSLSDEPHITKHKARTGHTVRQITSIEESILAFCYLNEGAKTPSDFCLSAANARLKHCTLKRSLKSTDDSVQSKRVKESDSGLGVKEEGRAMVTAWFCECSQQLSTEEAAEKHMMTANQISYKCLVCGKLADDAAIIRLHMCRFHGGARLDSFLFWCGKCKTELTRMENVLAHIIDRHGGHSFYYEQDVPEDQSSDIEIIAESSLPPQPGAGGLWQCHICEEMFDSEETVKEHCKSLAVHHFQKYCCDTCKKKFQKMETFLRHCQLLHNGDIRLQYFCGLCKDLYLNEEAAFLGHYHSFHSLDYSHVPNQVQSDIKVPQPAPTRVQDHEKQRTCGCLTKYTLKERRKVDIQLCLDRLFRKGKLWYSCSLCPATHQTIEGLNTHVCKGKAGDAKVVVKCSLCSKFFAEAEDAQTHYHMKHCFLQETSPNYDFTANGPNKDVFKFTASGTSTHKPPRPKASLKTLKRATHKATHKSTHVKPLKPKAQGSSGKTSASHSTKQEPKTEAMEIESTNSELQDSELPDLEFLGTMTHIVFIDLDNWAQFFSCLPGYLNQGTFVWGFHGGKSKWKPPVGCKIFKYLCTTGCFFLHPRCCDRKDAADFAICIHAGRLDERLPKQIPFTVLSGDKGFLELENQFKKTQRKAHILNPHHMGGDLMCALLNSIAETTQDAHQDDMETGSTGQAEDSDLNEAIRRSLLEM